MLCLECQELIIKKVTYKNIFKKNIHKICNNCFSKYIFIQELEVLPINNAELYLNVLFNKIGNPMMLMSFLKPYYIYYLKYRRNQIILYFDTFNKVVYNILQNITLGDIYLIVLHNENEKENEYDGRSNW